MLGLHFIVGDYDDFVVYDEEMLSEMFPNAREFVETVEIELVK